jgi:hypothetical protein
MRNRNEDRDGRDRVPGDAVDNRGRWDVADGRRDVAGDRREIVSEEKRQFGGMKFGSAFFGWLTATGMAVLLGALAAAIGAGTGMSAGVSPEQIGQQPPGQLQSVGLVGAIVLAVLLFIAYYCGGYVAGRMARFSGAKQGLAVWLWAVVVAVLFTVVGLVAGNQFDVLANLNAFPRIPLDPNALTTTAVIALVVAAVVALVGAVLGGLAGMRFHRKVDRAGFGA